MAVVAAVHHIALLHLILRPAEQVAVALVNNTILVMLYLEPMDSVEAVEVMVELISQAKGGKG